MKIKTNKGVVILGALTASLAIAVVWLVILLLTRPVVTETPAIVELDSREVVEGQYSEEVDVLMEKTSEILKEAIESQPKGLEETAEEINTGNFKSLPKSFKKLFNFSSILTSKENETLAYQSVLAIAFYVREVNESFEIVPGAGEGVFLDMEKGIAAVPMSIFTGVNSGFYFEFVYDNDEWIFMPYSVMQSSVLSAIITQDQWLDDAMKEQQSSSE